MLYFKSLRLNSRRLARSTYGHPLPVFRTRQHHQVTSPDGIGLIPDCIKQWSRQSLVLNICWAPQKNSPSSHINKRIILESIYISCNTPKIMAENTQYLKCADNSLFWRELKSCEKYSRTGSQMVKTYKYSEKFDSKIQCCRTYVYFESVGVDVPRILTIAHLVGARDLLTRCCVRLSCFRRVK